MQATIEDQMRTIRLQELDNSIVGLRNKLANLPEQIEFKELEIQFNTARDLRIAAETELKDVSVELSRAEGDVEQVANREAKDEARLNAGQGSPKELEQMQHELKTLAARRSELEEIELEVMLRVDGLKDRIAQLAIEENALNEKVQTASKLANEAKEKFTNEFDTAVKNRAELAAQVEPTLFALYDKQIKNGRNGSAMLENGECRGCNLAINPVELKKIKEKPLDEVVRCEECGCILVRG